jgi:hypothetical protein
MNSGFCFTSAIILTALAVSSGSLWATNRTTAEERLALNAYLLAGLTEYWRAYRQYAGVLHFVYLTSSDPAGYTSDHFQDVRALKLHPEFRDYMSNAFAPVGISAFGSRQSRRRAFNRCR